MVFAYFISSGCISSIILFVMQEQISASDVSLKKISPSLF